ncbi:MAG: bifunctional phosphopantothenoylcysteine decarboxylase/phosphopantothenate--cysteine ligase CoaBC [Acidobacteriota bacterium]
MKAILAVTGCIAAYKAPLILRLLQQAGVEIFPVMTRSAQQFLGAKTLEALSGHPVVTEMFPPDTPEIEHISLARRADLLLVAPATANILAKFAAGIADDFLSTLYLSTTTPVMVAPAMNVEMWHHPATVRNLAILRERGVEVVDPGSGYQACGEVGEGRLADPEVVAAAALRRLRARASLEGIRVLVTAGPTVEDVDAVRFLSNRSSGRMGFAVAREAALRGARVTLVSGPVQLHDPPGVEVIRVRSAAEMAAAVLERFPSVDVVVKAAAVADYRPSAPVAGKLKKSAAPLKLELEPTLDILARLGAEKTRQILVGFAAEADGLLDYAREKLQRKNLDLVVANDIRAADSGFGSDWNRCVFIDRSGEAEELPLIPKQEVAARLWDRIEQRLAQRAPV